MAPLLFWLVACCALLWLLGSLFLRPEPRPERLAGLAGKPRYQRRKSPRMSRRNWRTPLVVFGVALLAALIVTRQSFYGGVPKPTRAAPSAAAATVPPVQRTLEDIAADIRWRKGATRFPEVSATWHIPDRFRFATRRQLLELTDFAMPDTISGWALHRTIEPIGDFSWHVTVRTLDRGWVSDTATLSDLVFEIESVTKLENERRRAAGRPQIRFRGFTTAPAWSRQDAVGFWVKEYETSRGQRFLDCYAVRLGRNGGVLFSIEEFPPLRAELCMRLVRLQAYQVQFDPGQNYDNAGRNAPYSLRDLITGFALLDRETTE